MPTIFYSCWRKKSEKKCKNIRYHFHLIAIHRGLVDEWIVWIARKNRKQNAEQWTTQHDLRYGWNVLFSVFRAFPSNSENNVKMYESWEILFSCRSLNLVKKMFNRVFGSFAHWWLIFWVYFIAENFSKDAFHLFLISSFFARKLPFSFHNFFFLLHASIIFPFDVIA